MDIIEKLTEVLTVQTPDLPISPSVAGYVPKGGLPKAET